ncbi:MAG: hypothetical protein AB7K37_14650 [Cyclobacteriaceae bacterium]
MDLNALDKALQQIIIKRNELSALDYNNPRYDELEEQLHDLEDDFQESYGDFLEGILQELHDEISPDTDVLYPIAYIAKSYDVSNNEFKVAATEGIFVEIDKYKGKETKLVLLPNPTRVILNVGKEKQEVLWIAN